LNEPNSRHLCVIGAGPKAVAIAAKRHVLLNNKVPVPELVVFDPNGLAANWGGEHGYTDGMLPLGTPPEKDVGFPYATDEFDPTENRLINTEMLEYSWAAFNVQNDQRSYADWVDRGRPHPQHSHWAEYLQWVADRIGLEVGADRLLEIGLEDGRWQLRFATGTLVDTDALIVTGPGHAHTDIEVRGGGDRVFNGESFWRREARDVVHSLAGKGGRACVIGSGETAAAIVVQLVTHLRDFRIDIISREGIIYTRGESYEENRLYSDPSDWLRFPAEVRRKFVTRTDRGVFSVTNKSTVNKSYNVRTVTGEVASIEAEGEMLRLDLSDERSEEYDLVVDATGFCAEWFVEIMDDHARAALDGALAGPGPAGETCAQRCRRVLSGAPERPLRERLAASIGHDLAVSGLEPRLHLPMFAGIEQGPGFPNLGCLGILSDRILRPHCRPAAAAIAA
jgi:mycobactin lysine-N-oxygenase